MVTASPKWSHGLFGQPKDFEKTLRQVKYKDLVPLPDRQCNGTFIKLTIVAEGFIMTAFHTYAVDEDGNQIRISMYNLPTTGTAHTTQFGLINPFVEANKALLGKTLLKKGVEIYIKDPWLKVAMDGLLTIRVEDSKDVAILQSSSRCFHCSAPGNPTLLRCARCRGAFYCGKDCQTADWKLHKIVCRTLSENQEHHEAEFKKNGR